MARSAWLNKILILMSSAPVVAPVVVLGVALGLALVAIPQAQAQTPTYAFGAASNGLRLCYPVDSTGGVIAGTDPVSDELCPITYTIGIGDDGTQRCFPAEASGAILVGRQPVDSTFCPAPMTTVEPPPHGGLPPGAPGPLAPGQVPGQPPGQAMQPPPTPPLTVKIASVNDVLDPNHAREIIVHPGDMIRLSADHFDPSRGYSPTRSYAEDFIWSASDFNADVCDIANRSNCFGKTNFQATNYGVIFYVPYTMGATISITVTSHNPRAIDAAGNPVGDSVVLRNAHFSTSWLPPRAVVTSAEDYRYEKLDADLALAGHGHWVWIDGVRYFAPTTYMINDKKAWEPYRHGYWAFDNTQGWTWISYDPWGWFTEHYGVWRHHGMYGWVWLPFPDLHYVPHAVTFFTSGSYVGWYPYHHHFAHAYRHGRRQAFIDGFEHGLRAAQYAADNRFRGGFTLVQRAHFNQVNIFNYTIINQTTIHTVATRAMAANTMGRSPGGSLDRVRKFVMASNGKIPMTQSLPMVRGGGGRLIAPSLARPMPPVYAALAKNSHGHLQAPLPFGSTRVLSAKRPDQMIKTVAPSVNGKAFAVPPHGLTPAGKRFFSPPLTANPTQPNKQNPIYSRQNVVSPPAPGQAMHKPLPAFQPDKAPPAHLVPQPLPTGAPHDSFGPPPDPQVTGVRAEPMQPPSAAPMAAPPAPRRQRPTPQSPIAPQTPVVPPPTAPRMQQAPPALMPTHSQPAHDQPPHFEPPLSPSMDQGPSRNAGPGFGGGFRRNRN